MKLTLHVEGELARMVAAGPPAQLQVALEDMSGVTLIVKVPEPDAPCAETIGGRCPHCNHFPLRVYSETRKREDRDTYAADGRCFDCKEVVGTLRARMSTIFGLEEDERLLEEVRKNGGKVY